MKTLTWSLVVSVCLVVGFFPAQARAQYRLPCAEAECLPGSLFDHSLTSSVKDWSCGSQSYGDHAGSDFLDAKGTSNWSATTFVRAPAEGIVVHWLQNCADTCSSFDGACATSCSSELGNHVVIQDRFGFIYVLGHLKKNSPGIYQNGVRLRNFQAGDIVKASDVLGVIGSSGKSTGKHVHFAPRYSLDVLDYFDPYAGACATRSTFWTKQGLATTDAPSTTAYACGSEPGVRRGDAPTVANGYQKNYTSLKERLAFQNAYGYTGYLVDAGEGQDYDTSSRLGCPQTMDLAPSYVHDVGNAVVLQDYYQPDASNRFPGEGDTAIVMKEGGTQAYLLRSGFWGVYKCLVQDPSNPNSARLGGPKWLGAPTSSERRPLATDIPGHDPSTDEGHQVAFQSFERGYMSYLWNTLTNGGELRVHVNNLAQANEVALASASSACGAILDVLGNPPTEPDACILGSQQACYDGPLGTSGVGMCQSGVQICEPQPPGGNHWSACVNQVLPSSEDCFDGLDSDCDDLIDCHDPDCASLSYCQTGTAGSSGSSSGGAMGAAGSTAGSAGASGSAGSAGMAGSAGSAGSSGSAGVAGSAGSAGSSGAAGANGSAGSAGSVGTVETCNGLDDDGNGMADETFLCRLGVTMSSYTCVNACGASGYYLCVAPSCTWECRSYPEDCTDTIDNDCNGLTDCADPACSGTTTCQVQTTCQATDTTTIQVLWTPPAGRHPSSAKVYGALVANGMWQNHWSDPAMCQLFQVPNSSSWACLLPLPSLSSWTFNLQYQEAAVGTGWVFDHNCWATGGCGHDVGTVTLFHNSEQVSFTETLAQPSVPEAFNGVVDSVPCP